MNSRIQKSIMNAKVNTIFYVLMLVLAFFSRKYFLQNLGKEFMGLTGTLGDMLNLMNITELGIGTAVGVTLYKPLFSDDRETITDIVSVFGFLYTRVGAIIAAAGLILSCFFPLIFADAGVPLYVVYLMFFSMLYASLLGYFINYRQIILSASQQNYVIMIRYNTAMIVKTILQIFVSFLPSGYIWWILLEALAITVYSFILNRAIRQHFPWLETSIARGKAKFKEYKGLWTKTKQVFAYKLCHLVFNSSTSIFIYAFATLSSVALYGNYNMIMSKAVSFIDGLFTGMTASVGNLIAEDNVDKTLRVFKELLAFRYLAAGVVTFSLYFVSTPLIRMWLGAEYELSSLFVALLALHFFISQVRIAVDNFKDGYGIFQDVWAPIAEVVSNIVFSCILGYLYGLTGIILALILSEFFIKLIWKPYYLFKVGFKRSVLKEYWPLIFKYYAQLLFVGICLIVIDSSLQSILTLQSWSTVVIYSLIMGLSAFFITVVVFYLADNNTRVFAKHILNYRRSK